MGQAQSSTSEIEKNRFLTGAQAIMQSLVERVCTRFSVILVVQSCQLMMPYMITKIN